MQECPCMFGHPPYVCKPLYVLMMFGCPLYIHNTKKACFIRLRGCPYPSYIWMPPYVWMPLYVQMTPICLDTPTCLDAPHMFGHPICLDAPLYVWMPAVHVQHKESMLCQTDGVSTWPLYIWMHLYVWMPPVCLDIPKYLDTTHMFGYPSYLWMPPYIKGACKHTGGSQTYGEHTNIQGVSKYMGASNHTEECPHIGGTQTYGVVQTYREV